MSRGGRDRCGLLLLLVGGALLHVFVLMQNWADNPFSRSLFVDSEHYWAWAGEIASGQLVGETPFFSAPLYPYLLGLLRAMGVGLLGVYILQLVLHLWTAALVRRIGAQLSSPAAGWGAAVLWLLLADPGYYTGRVLACSLQAFLVALLTERSIAVIARPSGGGTCALGVVTGLTVLSWPPAVVMIPVVALAVAWNGGFDRGALKRGLQGAGVACLVISPATLHNFFVGGEWITVTAHGGITFYHGNNRIADGTFSPLGVSNDKRTHDQDALRQTRAARGPDAGWRDVSEHFRSKGMEWWRENPTAATALALRKAAWYLSGRVYGDMYLASLEREESFASRLKLAFVPVAWCTLPALLMALVLARKPRENLVLLALVGLALAIATVFWYSPRYRMPVTPLIAVLAAAAAARFTFARMPERVAYGGVLLLGLFTGHLMRAAGLDDPETYRGRYELRVGDLRREAGEEELARKRYLAARDAGAPEAMLRLAELSAAQDPAGALEELAAIARANPGQAQAQKAHAVALAEAGRLPEASAAFEAALALEADDGEVHAGLATVLLQLGQGSRAAGHLDRAIELLGPAPDLYFNRALARRTTGDLEGAVSDLEETRDLDPAHDRAGPVLYQCLIGLARDAEAVAVLREELDRQPGHPEIGLLLAWTLATSPDSGVRDGAEALGLAGQSREGVGDRWDVLDTLAAAHAETGDFDQAVELARRALELARGLEVSAELSTRLGLYEAGTAYREPR